MAKLGLYVHVGVANALLGNDAHDDISFMVDIR